MTPLKRKASEMASSPAATEAEELAALDKALTALGFTDDSKLERVLHVLMPRVVDQMASAHASTKKKVMEILSHVNKRLKAQPTMRLPLEDLTALYVNPERPPMVRNFALVYVEQAHARATPEDRAAQILPILRGVASRTQQHRDLILRLAVEALAVPEKQCAAHPDDMPFLLDPADRAAFLDHALEYLMYQPNSSGHAPVARPGPTPAERALRGVANVAGVAAPQGAVQDAVQGAVPGSPPLPAAAPSAPPGMSPASVERVLGPGVVAPSVRRLGEKKFALLEFFNRASDATLPPPELILHYLVATCDADNDVSRRGEDLLRRRCTWETNRPSVNLEDPAMVAKLYRAFLGGAESVPARSRALPASPALKMRLVGLMCRSVAAANAFPSTVQTIFTCLYGAGTTVRLKASGMELAVWVLRHATDAQLRQASPLLLSGMLKLLDGNADAAPEAAPTATPEAAPTAAPEAAPTAASTAASVATPGAVSLRGFCYQALGQLAARQPALVNCTPDVAARVFSALATEPEGVRASVHDAARSLSAAYRGCGGGVAMAIEGLLLSSIETGAESAEATASAGRDGKASRRLVAAQWARRLFPFDHAPARYLCVVAAGDPKPDVREEGRAGLRPPNDDDDAVAKRRRGHRAIARTEAPDANEDEGSSERSPPSAAAMLAYLAAKHPEFAKPASLGARLPMPPLAVAAALTFVRRCVAEDVSRVGNDDPAAAAAAAAPEGYRLFLERCLTRDAPADLAAAATTATLELAEANPDVFADADVASSAYARARHFAGHVDGPTRRVAAKLCGALAPSLRPAPTAAADALKELLAVAGKGGAAAGGADAGVADRDRGGMFDAVHGRFETQDGALRAAGYVAAAGGVGPGASPSLELPPGAVADALAVFVAVAGCKNPTLAGTAAEAIGHVGFTGPLPLPRAPRLEPSGEDGEDAKAEAKAKAAPAPAPEGTMDLVIERLRKVMGSADQGAAQRAARAAGFVIAGGCEWKDARALLRGAFALSKCKNEETQLAVGEALAFAFGGVGIEPARVLFGSFTTLEGAAKMHLESLDDLEGLAPRGNAADVDGGGAETAASASAAAAPPPAAASPAAMDVPSVRALIRDEILGAIFDTYLYSSRPEERCAACTWLLALVVHTRRHPRLLSMLPEIQEAFGSLLGDQNELTQEMASRGVSVVYELGTEEQRKELLASLMGTLSGEQKKRKVKLADDSRVFAEGTIRVDDKALAGDGAKRSSDESGGGGGGGGGGSLGTYKELCSIVNDIGQPDLIYKFMDLANYQAMLNSSKGAAYGFASIAKRAGDALAPHLAKLLPKLYRMQHDPNPRMQEAVKGIWQAVVDDPKTAVDSHFAAVMEELLGECGSRQWRARQSAASALAELLSGRRFVEVEPYLERAWTVSLRVVDDIKETVREVGKTLCRSVRGLTVRLCDAHHSSPEETRKTIAATLPLLLQTGLLSPVKEIQSLSMDVVMKVAKQAGSAEIRPHVPEMVKCLLEALSSMEDSRLNYIEQHAASVGLSAERLEHARLQNAKASPMGETLDVLMAHVDEEVMKDLVPAVGSVLRSGVGLNTRAGAGRFIARLCLRRGSLVRPHAGKLFKALLGAAASDRSASVTTAMVSALAAVARHAAEPRVHRLVEDLAEMYDDVDGDAAEKRRALAAHLALELSRNASDALRDHAARILPLAFVGRFDQHAGCTRRWEEVWEENASGASSTVRLYLDEIVAACAARLTSAQYHVKRQGAAAMAEMAKVAPEVVAPKVPEMLELLLGELPGRVWEGKDAVPKATADVAEACPEATAAVPGGGARVIAALVTEASRKKIQYRKAALAALDRALAALAPADGDPASAPDFLSTTMPLLRELLAPRDAAMDKAEETNGGNGGNTVAEMEEEAHRREREAKASEAAGDAALGCLATALAGSETRVFAAAAEECASLAEAALAPEHPWTRRAAGLRVMSALATRAAKTGTRAEGWLSTMTIAAKACGVDPRTSQLRSAAAEALGAATRALGEKSEVRAACVEALEEMRDGDRAPDVRGAAGRALEGR